jgi:hypothetical protein
MTLKLPPLPEMLRIACKVGGMDAVLALSEAFGGRQMKIPKPRCGDDHPLVQVAGRAVADAICNEWPGHQLEVPRGGAALRVWLAATLLAEGATLNQLVGELRISHRWARKLKRQVERGGAAAATVERAGRRAERDERQGDIEAFIASQKR